MRFDGHGICPRCESVVSMYCVDDEEDIDEGDDVPEFFTSADRYVRYVCGVCGEVNVIYPGFNAISE